MAPKPKRNSKEEKKNKSSSKNGPKKVPLLQVQSENPKGNILDLRATQDTIALKKKDPVSPSPRPLRSSLLAPSNPTSILNQPLPSLPPSIRLPQSPSLRSKSKNPHSQTPGSKSAKSTKSGKSTKTAKTTKA
eukprot:CAMPEP_0197006354 /NCGR_PEP_ID=MMETSP1380-20130617/34483_1 /TAXON_ID=5936 /ORGANISM="Euplotes crassus, Strain CT5" /LENGTH=132 /DNA_ID=CAMNT_0042425907 /DNA_START=496 /DNA_END=891 /DNA_ORIENTATION=-